MDTANIIKKGIFERTYRKHKTSTSTNPAIAYLMNHLAELEENDRVLDPCCGTGTILIERQLLKKATCLGVEIHPKVLNLAWENIKKAKVKINLKHADIKTLKYPENTFTKIISNLPWGIHSGSREENIILYRFLAQAAEKWLCVGGKVVFLTPTKKILWNAFADKTRLKFVSETEVEIEGLKPSIFVYQKI